MKKHNLYKIPEKNENLSEEELYKKEYYEYYKETLLAFEPYALNLTKFPSDNDIVYDIENFNVKEYLIRCFKNVHNLEPKD